MDPKTRPTPALATEAVRIAEEAEKTVAIATRALEESKRQMKRAKLLPDGQVTAMTPDAPEKIDLK
jgi:hypothetical protein